MIIGALISMAAIIVGSVYVGWVHRVTPLAWPGRPGSRPWWAQRLGQTRWRRVNVPVVGPVLFAASMLAGVGTLSSVLGCVAIGMTAAALAGRWIDPLPPLPRP